MSNISDTPPESGSGTTILIVFFILLLCAAGGFGYWYFSYRCHSNDWKVFKNFVLDKSLSLSNTNITVCTAQITARKNNYPAFYLVSNTSGKFDAYYYPSTTKSITIPDVGTSTLYYISNTFTINPRTLFPSPSPSPS